MAHVDEADYDAQVFALDLMVRAHHLAERIEARIGDAEKDTRALGGEVRGLVLAAFYQGVDLAPHFANELRVQRREPATD